MKVRRKKKLERGYTFFRRIDVCWVWTRKPKSFFNELKWNKCLHFSRIIFFSYAWNQMMKLKKSFSHVWVMKKRFGMTTTFFQYFFVSMCESKWDTNKRILENLVKLNKKKIGNLFLWKSEKKKHFDRGATFFRRICFLHVCSVKKSLFFLLLKNNLKPTSQERTI